MKTVSSFRSRQTFYILMRYILDARALFERVIPNFSADRARPLWERWARYEYQYGDLEAALKLEKRMAEVYASGMVLLFRSFMSCLFYIKDPPIKRFAQRHMYLGIDAIADRDLGFAMARKATATSSLGKSETQQSLLSSGPQQGTKRMASPDYRSKREDNRGGSGGSGGDYNNQGSKRMRPSSPPPRGVDRDRETRWEGGPSSRRRPFSPPPPPTSSWDRDDRPRAREPPPPSRAHEREEEKPRQVSVPPVISWFVGDLPSASSFDGEFF
jgi:cleavage stimulation factor subunit 3